MVNAEGDLGLEYDHRPISRFLDLEHEVDEGEEDGFYEVERFHRRRFHRDSMEMEENLNIAESSDEGLPLHDAIREGNFEKAKALLDKGRSVWERGPDGWYPLHMAAMDGHADLVDLLLNRGAKINAKDFSRMQPLHFAAEYGHAECIAALLDRGANVDEMCSEGTPLHLATRNDNVECVKVLLERNARSGITNSEGWTPLHLAARGHADCLKVYLEHGACASDNRLREVLHAAVEAGCSASLDILLQQHGVDVNARDDENMTPLHKLCDCDIEEKIDLLGCIKLLIKHKAEIDAIDGQGRTPLMCLCEHSDVKDAIALMAECGANINVRNSLNGRTALSYLLENDSFLTGKRGKKATVKFLLSKGANCKLRDEDGHTPLMSYIMTGECSISIIQVLLNAGSDVNAQDSVGASVLQLAAKYCERKIVKHLLINGANAKLADGKGTTALMSCIGMPTKIMKLLVVSGGVELLNAKNSEGRTALHLAALKNDKHALLFLLSKGANISLRDEDGMTALSLASSTKCQTILQKASSVVIVQKTGVKK